MLGPMLLTVHNLTYYQRLMAEAAQAIEAGPVRRVLRQRRVGGLVPGGGWPRQPCRAMPDDAAAIGVTSPRRATRVGACLAR